MWREDIIEFKDTLDKSKPPIKATVFYWVDEDGISEDEFHSILDKASQPIEKLESDQEQS